MSAWIIDITGTELWEIPDITDPSVGTNHGELPTAVGIPTAIAFRQGSLSAYIADQQLNALWEIPDPATPGVGHNRGTFPTGLGHVAAMGSRGANLWFPRSSNLYEITNPLSPGTATNHGAIQNSSGSVFNIEGLTFHNQAAWLIGQHSNTSGLSLVEIPDPEVPGNYTVNGVLPFTAGFSLGLEIVDGVGWIVKSATPAELWRIPDLTNPGGATLYSTSFPSELTSPSGIWAMDTIVDLFPSIPDLADMANSVGDTVDVTLPEATGGNPPLSYSISGLPQGLTFDETTRRITGTISGSPQTYTITYNAIDTDGDPASVDFAWRVTIRGELLIVDAISKVLYTFSNPYNVSANFTVQSLPASITGVDALTWTGDALLLANRDGDLLYRFPDPADLTTFTTQALPPALTNAAGMAWSGTALFIADLFSRQLFTFTNPNDLSIFTVQVFHSK